MEEYYSISAVVPSYNAEATLKETLESIKSQGIELDELIVFDDGSTDSTIECAYYCGAMVEEMQGNKGRGYVRALSVEQALGEFVLSCDSAVTIGQGFLRKALSHFKDEYVAVVFGSPRTKSKAKAIDRWKAKYLFREGVHKAVNEYAPMLSCACIMRKESILGIGNFDISLKEHEDYDLGQRLLKAGYKVVHDPELVVHDLRESFFWDTLERYARWNQSSSKRMGVVAYARQVWFSLRTMAYEDLRRGDWRCALISLFSPHYQMFCSTVRRF